MIRFVKQSRFTSFLNNIRFISQSKKFQKYQQELVSDRPCFPQIEQQILKFWSEKRAFYTQLQKTKHFPQYTFYDGPPFATGLPHYGHIAAGTIKDVVTRYASQSGHYVPRKFGWDCHGLPIEFQIDKELKINTKQDFQKYGIERYNEACRNIVMRYSSQWRDIVTRFGRWIDFDQDYKTMGNKFK